MKDSICTPTIEPYEPSPCSSFGFKGLPGQVMDITNVTFYPSEPDHPREPQQLPGEPPPGPWELLFQEWQNALDQKMYKAVRAAFDRSFILIDEVLPDKELRERLYQYSQRTFREHYI